MTTKIVIEINGGVVQEVYADDPAVTVVVVDWDTEGSEPGGGNYVVKDDMGKEHLAHAAVIKATPIDMLPVETIAAAEEVMKSTC